MMRLIAQVTQPAAASVVQMESGGKVVALGTAIDESLVITKASLLGDTVSVRQPGMRAVRGNVVAVSRDHDLAIVEVAGLILRPIRWADGRTPPLGSLIASPDADGRPVAMGVISVAPRPIGGSDARATLGVRLEDGPDGALVSAVYAGTAAEQANLRKGDEIVVVDRASTRDAASVTEALRHFYPGDTVRLHVRRDGQTYRAEVRLDNVDAAADLLPFQGGQLSRRRSGFPAAFQHDGVVEPDACGGPVLGLDGQALGINIARAGRTETYAIPAEALQDLIPRLLREELADRR